MALTQIINSGIGQVTDIKLGGSGSANTLDDYEEGTWTPVFADAASGGNESSTTATYANYVKVGSLVHINCRFTNISTSGLTSTNGISLTGLPYVSNGEAACAPWLQNVNVNSSTVHVVARLGNAFSYLRFDNINDNSADNTLTVSAFTNNVADIALSLTYTTDA